MHKYITIIPQSQQLSCIGYQYFKKAQDKQICTSQVHRRYTEYQNMMLVINLSYIDNWLLEDKDERILYILDLNILYQKSNHRWTLLNQIS